METVYRILNAPEFWMGLSLLAALLPGPQTRLIPLLFRAVADLLQRNANPPHKSQP